MVDGDAAWRRTIGRVFESRGHRVIELTRTGELPAKLAGVDALMLDPQSERAEHGSDKNGTDAALELIARLRKERGDMPIAVMSSDANVESIVKAMRLGIVDYMTKPADQRRVSEAADHILEACTFQAVALGLTRLPTLDEIEKRAIDCALSITKGQVSQAARMLGIGRATLYRKLAEMGRTPASRATRIAV